MHSSCRLRRARAASGHTSLLGAGERRHTLPPRAVQSVKADGGLLKASDNEFGAEWKLAAGAPRKKEARGRSTLTAAVPSVHLRLEGEFRAGMIAAWCLNASQPGADLLVRPAPHRV